MNFHATIAKSLQDLRERGLWRTLRPLRTTGSHLHTENDALLNFASNDYLNLAAHPKVIDAAQQALGKWGCGATSSRLLAGNLELHEALEAALARLCQQESALVFPSGFQANLAVLSTVAQADDVIYSDALNHASLIDGCRLSKARVRVYPHGDTEALAAMMAKDHCEGKRILLSDSLFSMDGDAAPLEALAGLAEQYDALLILDEAHALGVFGQGGGLAVARGIQPHITLGTLSKALGSGGGFVACSQALRDWLINRARPFIYSTGLSPANAAAALAATEIITADPSLGATLLQRKAFFHQQLADSGLALPPFQSQIIPVLLGENETALNVAARMAEAGIFAPAIRPPTVPEGTARLRLSVTLGHTEKELARAAAQLAEIAGACVHGR